jgi:hypothetical protein
MAAFDDSADPALGAACNRLAAWVEPLPAGVMIDPASGLSEPDLALILRHLYATRHAAGGDDGAPRAARRSSVPLTARE